MTFRVFLKRTAILLSPKWMWQVIYTNSISPLNALLLEMLFITQAVCAG